ncbi:MAG: hypothetical protein KKA62_05840 [Nanoarchaeota archaeon]|nr:hypothetical protein [Nanoarchaeota archaeon]MBU1643853.1 hypothetical protein [Nanoarchaeota archaeon]MBU1977445.1 hypothetical protein [Nanoarchaeota archaeon]
MEIKLKDFEKLNLKVGSIKAVKKHPQTKDYIILVDIGKTGADKQVVVDLKGSYSMAELIGKKVVLVQNTEISVVKGIESQGLLLAASKNGRSILIEPPKTCVGAKVVGLSNKEFSFKEN